MQVQKPQEVIRASEIRERNGVIKAYLEIIYKEKRKTLQHHLMVHS